MRASTSGSIGAMLVILPLIAIPVLAIVGVPQFAPLVASPAGNSASDIPALVSADLGGSAADLPAEDIYAPVKNSGDAEADRPLLSGKNRSAPRWDAADDSAGPGYGTRLPARSEREENRKNGRYLRGSSRDEDDLETSLGSSPDDGEADESEDALGDWELAEITSEPTEPTVKSRLAQASRHPSRTRNFDHQSQDEYDSPRSSLGEPESKLSLSKGSRPGSTLRDLDAREPAQEKLLSASLNAPRSAQSQGNRRLIPNDELAAADEFDRSSPNRAGNARKNQPAREDDPTDKKDPKFVGGLVHPGRELTTRPAASSGKNKTIPAGTVTKETPSTKSNLPAAKKWNADEAEDVPPMRNTGLGSVEDNRPDPRASASRLNGSAGASFSGLPAMNLPQGTWREAIQKLKALGITDYRLELLPDQEEVLFVCSCRTPAGPRRFEDSDEDTLVAVWKVIAQVEDYLNSR